MVINKDKFILTFFILLIGSLVLNFILYHNFNKFYQDSKWNRIDPGNLYRYHDQNNKLKSSSTNKKKIVYFGDSRISQWEDLPEITGYQSINRGIEGETTTQALLRLQNDVIDLKPEITVLQTGINDLTALGIFPNKSDFIINSCKNNIKQIVKNLNAKKIHVVLLTILPAGEFSLIKKMWWSKNTRREIFTVNRFLKTLSSSGITLIDCDKIFLNNKMMDQRYSIDALHLNKDGYRKLNEILKPILLYLIKMK